MGTLAIAGNMGVSPQQVSFSGAAGAPSVSLPPSISFTGLLVGQTGAEASLGIYNVGNGPFILTSASVTGDYQIVTNGCTAPVAPNGSCQIVMNFSPSATGTRNGTLILNDNLTPSTQTIELIGQGLTSAPLPAITLIPAIAQITSGTGQIAVYGSGFMPNSTVYWNGSARATTYGGATVLIGTLSPSDLAKVGEATVTVGTPAPGGGTSAPAIATIFGQMPNLTILNEVYNLSTQLLYATVSSTSISNANSLVAIDPVAMQVVSTLLTGNNPDALAISGDGTLLYVGLDGLQSIAQLSLPSGTANFTVKVPEGGDTFLAQYGMMASALAVVPGQPHTWLLGICYLNTTPCGGGVAIFDDAVQRANIAFVQQLTANSLTFVNDPTVAYSTEFNQSPPNISSFSITSSGISLTATSPFEPGEGGGPLASDGKLLYVANGQVINPATLALEFTYPQGGSAFAIDIANQRLFFSGFSALYSFGGLDLTAVDQSTQATLGTIDFPEYGQAEDVRRFGTNGVVINNTWGGLIFVQTSLATIPVPPQLLTAAPATLTFAAQQQSTTSSAQNVVLTNGTSTAIHARREQFVRDQRYLHTDDRGRSPRPTHYRRQRQSRHIDSSAGWHRHRSDLYRDRRTRQPHICKSDRGHHRCCSIGDPDQHWNRSARHQQHHGHRRFCADQQLRGQRGRRCYLRHHRHFYSHRQRYSSGPAQHSRQCDRRIATGHPLWHRRRSAASSDVCCHRRSREPDILQPNGWQYKRRSVGGPNEHRNRNSGHQQHRDYRRFCPDQQLRFQPGPRCHVRHRRHVYAHHQRRSPRLPHYYG
jgi:hypothetical protein